MFLDLQIPSAVGQEVGEEGKGEGEGEGRVPVKPVKPTKPPKKERQHCRYHQSSHRH